MIVIRHHRIGAEINGKHLCQHGQSVHHPLAAMLVILAGIVILSTKKGPSHTATDTVIIGGRVQGYLGIASSSHG